MTISRSEFLARAAVMLTVPEFLSQCAPYPRLAGGGNDPLANAAAMGLTDPILQAINAGITAPNPHNTQAWKFHILSPVEMLLFIDEKRVLPVTDPPARQIHIGQGTFIELLSIGASKLGYSTRVDLLPEGPYETKDIGRKPVARIKLIQDKSILADPLFGSVSLRATNRAEYDGPDLTEAEVRDLMHAAGPGHSARSMILGSAMAPYKELLYAAMRRESLTLRTAEETRGWFRFNDHEIQTKRDGIALPDQGITGILRFVTETFFLGPEPEKFFDPDGNEMFLARYKKKIDSARALFYWKTETNTQRDWVNCGRDYARFHLAVTAAGLKMHPLSQALQEFDEMKEYREQLESLLGVKPPAKVQMIVRIGRSDYQYLTPRRAAREMIV